MKEKIEQIRQQALAAIEDAAGIDKLNDVKVAFLGKKGQFQPECGQSAAQILQSGCAVRKRFRG